MEDYHEYMKKHFSNLYDKEGTRFGRGRERSTSTMEERHASQPVNTDETRALEQPVAPPTVTNSNGDRYYVCIMHY